MKKFLKRTLAILLAIIMLVGAAPVAGLAGLTDGLSVTASAANYSGTCGENGSNLTWSLDTSTGVLTISGTGKMIDYSYSSASSAPWYSYRSNIKTVIIGNSVTSIGEYAFYLCTLTSVTIGNSVTSIGSYAFNWCTGLTSVTIPNSVTSIGEGAFYGWTGLTSVTISNSVTSIGNSAFAWCIGLTSVTIPNSVTSIGDYAFYHVCNIVYKGIASFSPWGARSLNGYVDGYVVYESAEKKTLRACSSAIQGGITIPNSVTSIGYDAFYQCTGLTSVTIPNSVTSIGDYAFYGCTGLTSVTIPNSVTSIGRWAFYYCRGLTSVTIPNSVTSIGDEAFDACYGLKDVYYSGSQAQWAKIEIGYSNDALTSATIHYNSTGGEIEQPDTVHGGVNFATGSEWSDGCKYEYSYSDSFFDWSSSKYSHRIAMMSAVLALSACVPDGGPYTDKYPKNIEPILDKTGFKIKEYYGYDSEPEFDSVACTVASKNTVVGNKETTIVLCAVRGGGYEAEWGGNFKMGKSSTNHEGFNTAKQKVLNYINGFIAVSGSDFKSNVIFWVTGYSRAAATANLVSAELNNGASGYYYINRFNPDKSKVYSYCFETPQGTTDTNAGSAAYNNIINIVNPIDPVPYLAPSASGFKFRRYGVTYYLPAAEIYKSYNDFKSGMSAVHKDLYGTAYSENFRFYEFKFGWTSEFKKTNSMKQMTYINNLVDILAKEVFENRSYYYVKLQDAISKIVAMAMGGWSGASENLLDVCLDSIKEYFLGLHFLSISPIDSLKNILASTISANSGLSYNNAYALLGELDSVLLTICGHPNYTYTASVMQADLFYPHYGDVTFAWMAYLEGLTDTQRNNLLKTNLKYRTYKINCPVNVNVYDEENNLVAAIVDDEPVEINGTSISYYVDENGQKCVVLPFDGEYRVEIIATDSGEVNCLIEEKNIETMQVEKSLSYVDMTVEEGDVITGTAETAEGTEECEYSVTANDGTDILPDQELVGDEIVSYNVSVTSNAQNESSVFGGGTVTVGEFVKVSAYPDNTQNFDGWYVDNVLVSSENEYRFRPNGDVEIEARFTTNSIVVTWNVDGKETTTSIKFGDPITKPADPVKEGYTFKGWTPEIPDTMPANNLTFTAVFESNTYYTVTWIVDGKTTTQQVARGAAITKPADPVKEGYTFKGWTPAVSATMPANDLTFTAQFEANAYKVNWVVDGKTTTISVKYGETITKPADPVKEGYTFKGWTPEIPDTMPANNLTFTAVFEKNQEKEPTVSIKNFTANKTVDYKTTITFTAEVKNAVSGTTVHWFIDGKDVGTGDKYTVSKAKKSFTVQAKYIKDGKVLAESGVEKVNVKTGFFAKLAAFFRSIFGALPKVVQGYLGAEIVEGFLNKK